MRFKGRFTKGLLVALIITLIPITAFSAQKITPGSNCKVYKQKVTNQNKVYTCIKSGKKLVWNKGVAVVKPTPTPIPTPTPTPTPKNLFVDGLYEENYDGYFENLTNLFLNEPKSSLSTNLINFQKGFDGKNEFSKQWRGYFIPNESGKWTFTVTSDDASYLWLGKNAFLKGTPPNYLIDLSGIHGPQTASATIFLNKGSAYPLRIIYGNSINFAQITLTLLSPSGNKFSDLSTLTQHYLASNSKDSGFAVNLDSIQQGETKIPISTEVWKNTPRDSVALAMQEILDKADKNASTYSGTITWVFQGDTSSEVEAATKRGLLNGIDLYAKLGFRTTNAIVLNARDMDWLKSQLTLFGCSYGGLPTYPGFYVPRTCQGGNGANTAQHWEVAKAPEGLDGITFNHVLAHEYFHQLQEQLSGNVGNGLAPLWFWEGGAHFFTLLAYSSWNRDRYYEQWSEHWFGTVSPDQKKNCVSVNIFNMQNSESGTNRVCGYSKGSLIVEYFVATYGIERYKNINTEIAQTPSMSFSLAFKRVTGEDLENFYVSAQAFLKLRGWS